MNVCSSYNTIVCSMVKVWDCLFSSFKRLLKHKSILTCIHMTRAVNLKSAEGIRMSLVNANYNIIHKLGRWQFSPIVLSLLIDLHFGPDEQRMKYILI